MLGLKKKTKPFRALIKGGKEEKIFGLIVWLSTIGFGCFRYCLDMRLQPARIEDAVAFLQRQCPTAQLLNRTADRLSFSIPQQVLAWLLGHCCLDAQACALGHVMWVHALHMGLTTNGHFYIPGCHVVCCCVAQAVSL